MKMHAEHMTPFTVPGAARSDILAGGWSQELARMQAAGWFHGAALQLAPAQMSSRATVPVHQVAVAGAGVASVEPNPAGQGGVAQTIPGALFEARAGGPPDSGAGAPRASSTSKADGATSPMPMTDGPSCAMTGISHASDPPSRPRTGLSNTGREQPGLRVHVENTSENALRVWLGIDGDATTVAVRAATVLAELRRQLATAGQRLESVVCNGAVIDFPPSHSSKELP